MAAPAPRSAAHLFNNRVFSDITILHIDTDGELHEYRVHKAVLGMESDFFYQQLTGEHQDLDDIKLSGDDTLHFELLLKYIYSNHYDTVEIEGLASNDIIQRVRIPMVFASLLKKDVRALLLEDSGEFKLLKAAIDAHYSDDVDVDSAMGKLIASVVMAGERKFTGDASYEDTLKAHPTFGVDMALAMAHDTINVKCSGTGGYYDESCKANFLVRSDVLKLRGNAQKLKCTFCGCPKEVKPK